MKKYTTTKQFNRLKVIINRATYKTYSIKTVRNMDRFSRHLLFLKNLYRKHPMPLLITIVVIQYFSTVFIGLTSNYGLVLIIFILILILLIP